MWRLKVESKTIFLNNLKELLELRGMSMREFSNAVKINRRTIYRWFETRSPKPASLIKIADYFNCSIDYLLGRSDNINFFPSIKRTNFLSRYKILRDKSGFNDYKISSLCQMSSGTISNWKEDTLPEFEVLIKLCEIFDCSVDYLVGRSEST